MFRKAIIALAASGLLAACAHTQETEDVAGNKIDPNEATTAPMVATDTPTHSYGKPAPVATPQTRRVRTEVKDEAKRDEKKVDEKAEARREPDNTGINKRDTDDRTLTPMDQSNSSNDLKITQDIRKAVVGAGGLSFTAKNVKIITRNANVVLRGPVKNASEKTRIDELARACAGVTHVDNQLEVETPN